MFRQIERGFRFRFAFVRYLQPKQLIKIAHHCEYSSTKELPKYQVQKGHLT